MNSKLRLFLMLAVMGVLGWLVAFGDKTPAGGNDVVALVVRAKAPSVALGEVESEDPAISGETDSSHIRRIKERSGLVELENGPQVALFLGRPPEPVAPPQVASAPVVAPPPPFVLIGRMYDRDHWLVFLERSGATHVLKANDEVDGYRIEAVSGQEVRLTQLVDKSKFVIPLDGDKKEPDHD